jgi:hypothetical protein
MNLPIVPKGVTAPTPRWEYRMGSATGSRWLTVESSSDENSHQAGANAAAKALIHDDAKLLIVFCSDRHDLPALLRGINEVSGGVPLIGCSTAGEIAKDGPGDHHVVVTALGGSGFQVATSAATGVSSRHRQAGEEVAGCVDTLAESEHQVLMLLTDGLAGGQEEIVRGAYAILGAGVPLVGGCAGDDLKMVQTSQLFGDRVLHDAVVAAAIGSDAPLGIGVHHGWRKVGKPMIATRSANSRVYALDEQPALDLYLRRLGAPESARTDPAAFTQFALTHPLGLSRRSGEEMRFIAEADFADRSLICVADVPQGGLVWLTEGDEDSVLDATDTACRAALEPLGGNPPLGLLAFDCIARRGVLGDAGIQQEVDRVAGHAGGAPVAGFYTYGEIARVRGINGFHNQTLVVLAVG